MKLLVTLFSLIFFYSFNKTLITQKTLAELTTHSDKILIGRVISVSDSDLYIQTQESIKGSFLPNYRIKKQQTGHISQRMIKTNLAGSTELFFLRYNQEEKVYSLFNQHGDAEYAIEDSIIYVYNRSWTQKINWLKYPSRFLQVGQNYMEATPFKCKDLVKALKDLLKEEKQLKKEFYKESLVKDLVDRKTGEDIRVQFAHPRLNLYYNQSLAHQRILDECLDNPEYLHSNW